MDKEDKVRYVKRQNQTRKHHCHWPGCTQQVPPAKWGCYVHWMMLPYRLRQKLWEAYRPGQENDMHPSSEYIEVAGEIREWILANYPPENEEMKESNDEPPIKEG